MSADAKADTPAPLRRGASEEVAQGIRDHILSEGLQPGDRVGREEDLATQFGVSRPTLREALRLLSSSHLIRATKGPGGGIFVDATPEQGIGRNVTESVAGMLASRTITLDELLETRMLLEVPIVGLAAQRATDREIEQLHELLAQVGEPSGVQAVDAALHQLIAGIAGNRLAGALVQWVAEVLQPPLYEAIRPAVVDEVVLDQHRDIVQAIERGDPTAAERAMREHLVYLRDLVNVVQR